MFKVSLFFKYPNLKDDLEKVIKRLNRVNSKLKIHYLSNTGSAIAFDDFVNERASAIIVARQIKHNDLNAVSFEVGKEILGYQKRRDRYVTYFLYYNATENDATLAFVDFWKSEEGLRQLRRMKIDDKWKSDFRFNLSYVIITLAAQGLPVESQLKHFTAISRQTSSCSFGRCMMASKASVKAI